MAAGADVLAQARGADSETLALTDAIGADSPLFGMIVDTYQAYASAIVERGVNDAALTPQAEANRECSAAGNPILDKGQLAGLVTIASQGDAGILRDIRTFASPDATNGSVPPASASAQTPPPLPPSSQPPSPDEPASQSPSPATAEAAAGKYIQSRGYTPDAAGSWQATDTLNAVTATKAGSSADGAPQLAFFFVDGRPIGTDTLQPSAGISLLWSTDNTIALQYRLYNPDDPQCCPSHSATVRYHWTGSELVPLDPIPPYNSPTAVSRR